MGVMQFLSLPKVLVFNRRKVQYSHLVENRHIIFEKDSNPFKAIEISVLFMMQSKTHLIKSHYQQ
jgi:hypothetical protein